MPKSPPSSTTPRRLPENLLDRFSARPEAVIPLLQAVQDREGYLSQESLAEVARHARTPLSRVYAVATFYSQFRLDRPGKHLVRVCQGTACHVLGATEILDQLKEKLEVGEGGTTADGEFTLETVRCLGCCSLAPAMMIDQRTYGRLTRKRIDDVIVSWREGKPA